MTLAPDAESTIAGSPLTGYTLTITGAGVVDRYAIAPAAPAGVSFSPETGRLTGTPTAAAGETVYTITAITATGRATATFTLTVLAATTTILMMVTEPGGAINGEIMTTQPVVRMTDAAGHTVTSFTGNVTAGAHTVYTVSNTRTVAAVAGVATFTDLAITGRAEPLTLRFTTDSGVAVHSAPFPLALGRAAKAMIATQPSGAVIVTGNNDAISDVKLRSILTSYGPNVDRSCVQKHLNHHYRR